MNFNTDLTVEIADQEVYIKNANGIEVVMWNEQEGGNPGVLTAVAYATHLAHTNPEKLVEINREHMIADAKNKDILTNKYST